jgi:hypothetical protein
LLPPAVTITFLFYLFPPYPPVLLLPPAVTITFLFYYHHLQQQLSSCFIITITITTTTTTTSSSSMR